MFPSKEKRAVMDRMIHIGRVVWKCKNMHDPEIVAMMSEWHDLAKAHGLYEWGQSTEYHDLTK